MTMNGWMMRSRRVQLTRVEQSLATVVRAVGAAEVPGDGGGGRHPVGGGAVGPVRGGHRPDEPTYAREALVDEPLEDLLDGSTLLLRATQWLAPVRRVSQLREELAGLLAAPLHTDDGGAAREYAELERRWLRRLGRLGADERPMLLADPVDLLLAGSGDVTVLCHGAVYASEQGRRAVPGLVEVDEAVLALVVALDLDDLELIASVLWLWPMLDLPWRAPAALAQSVLDRAYDEVCSSVRASLAHGILCAALLEHPVPRGPGPSRRHGVEPATPPGRRWEGVHALRDSAGRESLAPFVTMLDLRRACLDDDVDAVIAALAVAREQGHAQDPAARQAAAWVRRSTTRTRRPPYAC